MALAGHVLRRMMEHYSHIRMDAKRTAVNSLRPVASRHVEETAALLPN
jgi:hypothetical protein